MFYRSGLTTVCSLLTFLFYNSWHFGVTTFKCSLGNMMKFNALYLWCGRPSTPTISVCVGRRISCVCLCVCVCVCNLQWACVQSCVCSHPISYQRGGGGGGGGGGVTVAGDASSTNSFFVFVCVFRSKRDAGGEALPVSRLLSSPRGSALSSVGFLWVYTWPP